MGTQKELDPEQLARALNLPKEKILWALGKDPCLERAQTATTLKQAQEAYYEAPSGSEAQKLALEKWQQLSLIQAQAAATLKQAQETYRETPSGSEAEKLALEKWLSFCQTLKQARKAYNEAPSDSEAQKLAIIKMIELVD